MSLRPICFIATCDPAASEVFYRDVLGLILRETSPFALVFADGDTMLRIQIVDAFDVATHTVHGWQVDDIEREIAELVAKGVVFLTFEHLGQRASGVWATPNGDQIAWFNDPSGNVLSLTQFR